MIYLYLTCRAQGCDQWITCDTCDDLQCTVKDLDPQSEYEFRVLASNKFGKSDPVSVALKSRAGKCDTDLSVDDVEVD